MYKYAKEKGVTLVSLVVTIILLLILSTIAYQTGKSTIENARVSSYTNEMIAMQQKVNELAQELNNGNNNVLYYGTNIDGVEGATEALNGADVSDTSGYKYFDEYALEALGLEKMNQTFLVNIEKRSVVSLEGVKYKGKKYYTILDEDLPNSLYNVEYDETALSSTVNFDVAIDIQNGMRINVQNITYSGEVKKGSIYYGLENGSGQVTNWTKAINETTDTTYAIDVLQEGTYHVKIVDTAGNEHEETVSVHLANYEIAETGTKYITLAEAVNAAENNQTIKQIRNYVDASKVVVNGKSIIFDNNGRTMTKETYGITVNSGATLEVAGSGTITTSEKNGGIQNNGTLNITHTGTISSTNTENSRPIGNTGILNKTGSGTITSTSGYSTIGNIGNGAIATISAGTVASTGSAAIHTYAGGTTNIQETANIMSANLPAITVGGTNTASGRLNITGGTIESTNGTAIMTNESIDNSVTITGGIIKGKTSAINIRYTTDVLTIGNVSTELNYTSPIIQGDTYGVFVTSSMTWNFYSGIIKGTTAGYNTAPTVWREGCSIKNGTETIDNTTYKTAYLAYTPTVTFDPNGGTVEQTTKQVTQGEPYGELPTPTKTGYSFQGWTGKNMFTGLTKGKSINHDTGIESSRENSSVSDYIPISFSNNEEYFLNGLTNKLYSCIYAYGANKKFIGRTSGTMRTYAKLTNNSFTVRTGETEEQIAFIRVAQYVTTDPNVTGTIDDIDNLNIQLELGTTATEYEPYQIVTTSTTVTKTTNHTLYAKWEPSTYTVNFDAQGGTVSPVSKTVTYNSTYGTLPTPTKNGYTFQGWTNTIFPDGNIAKSDKWTPNQNVTVTKADDYVQVIYNQNTSTPGYIYRYPNTTFEVGKTYTISAYVKGVGTNALGVCAYGVGTTNTKYFPQLSTTEFTKVSATITFASGGQNFILLYQSSPTIGTGFQIKWLQVQEGEVATDYEVTSETTVTQTCDHKLYADWIPNYYSITTGGIKMYYKTLALAIADSSDGDTIKVEQDVTDTSTVTFNKYLTLDLQTYTITKSTTVTISPNKEVTITGSTGGKLTSGTTNVMTITNQGTLTIDGEATIEHNGTSTSYYAINNSTAGAILNVKSGTIISVTRGIYNNNATATTNIGDATQTMSTTNPQIIGGTHGVYISNGTVNFYSGILKGKTAGYYGTINARDGYSITTGTEDIEGTTYKNAYLVSN